MNTVYLMKSGIVVNFVFEQLDKNRMTFKLSFAQFKGEMDKTICIIMLSKIPSE
jgi:carboxyl-terminal processing protease